MTIKLYNTLTKNLDVFTPLHEGEVRIYSCGPTVYNHAHIGNMRAFLFADVLQRVMRVVGGYEVQWVMNITDIDDKTIRDSRLGSEKWLPTMGVQAANANDNLSAFTRYFESVFIDDISQLGIRKEHFKSMPRATEYIPQMQQLIQLLLDKGFAYETEGSVYFDLNAWRKADSYGKLFKVDFENFREGVRIDADEYERESISDFVLWKAQKDDEPFWEYQIRVKNSDTSEATSKSIPGRPGWHIECSAMGHDILGLPFDIHTGGVDLRFPHHEDEIAQSKAGYGVEPVNYWCHNEFLEVEGKKMSKSLGNFFTLHDLIERGLDPLDIRFAMLSAHYGSVYNFTFDGLGAAAKARARVQESIYDVWEAKGNVTIDIAQVRREVFSALAENIHTPKALASLFSFLNAHNLHELGAESRQEMLRFFQEINDVFDVWNINERPTQEAAPIPEEVRDLAAQRWQAKADRNFAKADEIRKQLTELGFEVKDTKDGWEVLKL